jgi:diaminopimelate epimerase
VSAQLRFAKYQAAGNDFILIEDLEDARPLKPDEASALCDRWFGVGADGVIRVTGSEGAPFAMHLTNADGSAAELSGNGMRCLGAFVRDRELIDEEAFDVATDAGLRRVALELRDGRVAGATVTMGSPAFARAAIPMHGPAWETFLDQPFDLGGGITVRAGAVSMGNPHLVLFVDEDPERFHVEHIGPALERHEWFPERTNVEFARVAEDGFDVRVWERGAGETLACGTGACAVVVIAHEMGLVRGDAAVRFRGGLLTVARQQDGQVLLGGPVAHVFDGAVDPSRL